MKNYLIAFITLFLIISCNGKPKEETSPTEAKPVVNDLPKMEITFLDGSKVQARDLTGKTLLVLFFPDCDHCQVEAMAMAENIKAFDGYTVYYLTSAPAPDIKKFADEYRLAGKPNFKFGMVTGESVIDNFGPVSTPSMYIFNKDKRLMKKFEGQTDIQIVISAL
jgi:peroxiredoxin